MYFAPIVDEDERLACTHEYSNSMADWFEFVDSTNSTYGVDMSCLEKNFEREQKEVGRGKGGGGGGRLDLFFYFGQSVRLATNPPPTPPLTPTHSLKNPVLHAELAMV